MRASVCIALRHITLASPTLPFLPLPPTPCLFLCIDTKSHPLPSSSFLYLPLPPASFLFLPLPSPTPSTFLCLAFPSSALPFLPLPCSSFLYLLSSGVIVLAQLVIAMTAHRLACMYKLRDRINELRSIPTTYRALLERRLVIACSEFKRQGRGEAVRSTREIKARHAEKRAHKLYLDVLDEDPQIFIPFLLVVDADTACVKYDLGLFRQRHDQRAKTRLGDADKVILEDIARRHGIGDSIAFQKLIRALFPATPSTATAVDGSPTTTADGPKPWRFNGSPLEVVRSQFAVGVFEAICKAPAKCGNDQFSTRTTTGSVWMDFPSVDSEDCILWLDIGDVDLFEKVLFPAGLCTQESGHDGEHTPGRRQNSREWQRGSLTVCRRRRPFRRPKGVLRGCRLDIRLASLRSNRQEPATDVGEGHGRAGRHNRLRYDYRTCDTRATLRYPAPPSRIPTRAPDRAATLRNPKCERHSGYRRRRRRRR